MLITPNMSLKAWDLESDPYDHTDLLNNAIAIDEHDHTPGKGAPLIKTSIPVLDSDNLGPCSVTRVQLCDFEVISQKLAKPAVQSDNLYDNSVTQGKVADNAIGSAELQDGAVTSPKIASAAVTGEKIAESAVTNSKIGPYAVSTSKIGDGAVTEGKILNEAVTNSKLGTWSVQDTKIAPNAVNNGHLQNSVVGPAELIIPPAAYVTIDHEHVVASADFHVLEWDNERYDTYGMWSFANRTQIVIPINGLYLIEAGVMWSEGGAGGNTSGRRARIRHNSTPIAGDGPLSTLKDDPGSGSAPYRVRHSLSTVFSCVTNDRLDVLVQQTAGANQRVVPDGFTTHFSATWIGKHPNG